MLELKMKNICIINAHFLYLIELLVASSLIIQVKIFKVSVKYNLINNKILLRMIWQENY